MLETISAIKVQANGLFRNWYTGASQFEREAHYVWHWRHGYSYWSGGSSTCSTVFRWPPFIEQWSSAYQRRGRQGWGPHRHFGSAPDGLAGESWALIFHRFPSVTA